MFIRCILIAWLSVNSVTWVNAAEQDTVEPHNTGWSFHIDNDLFFSSEYDQDYTGGAALSLSGDRARRYPWSLDGLRILSDRLSHFPLIYQSEEHFKLHTFEAGFVLFTPIDLSVSEPQFDDHPYASLLFLVNSQQIVVPEKKTAYVSALTVGFLGLSLGGEIQKGLHKVLGSDAPRGWQHQISAGGEPTLKYTMGVQKTLIDQPVSESLRFEFKLTGEGNLGMTTDVGGGFNFRTGRLATPWWGFNPHQAEYVNLGSPVLSKDRTHSFNEFFLYLGGSFKYRVYNAILQGQFRDSTVTFDRNRLNDIIWEGWAGASYEFNAGLKVSAFIRSRSAEIDVPGARAPFWGGFVFSKSH